MNKIHFNTKNASEYHVKNKEKYIGTYPVISRSSWELKVMQIFDTHPCISKWASESIKIPYINPITQRKSFYYPDFFVEYTDKYGTSHKELIEVKPAKETFMENAKSKRDKLALAVNYYKWKAAKEFCETQGILFRVINENDIFGVKLK